MLIFPITMTLTPSKFLFFSRKYWPPDPTLLTPWQCFARWSGGRLSHRLLRSIEYHQSHLASERCTRHVSIAWIIFDAHAMQVPASSWRLLTARVRYKARHRSPSDPAVCLFHCFCVNTDNQSQADNSCIGQSVLTTTDSTSSASSSTSSTTTTTTTTTAGQSIANPSQTTGSSSSGSS